MVEDDPLNGFLHEVGDDHFEMDVQGVQQDPLFDEAASSDEEQVKQMKENVKSILASKNLDCEQFKAVEVEMNLDNIDEDDEQYTKTESVS